MGMGGHCCCCFGLRTGTFLISIIYTIIPLAITIGAIMYWGDDFPDIYTGISQEVDGIIRKVVIGVMAVSSLISILLFISIMGGFRCPMLLWLIWNGIFSTVVSIFFLVVLGLCIWALVDLESLRNHLGWEPKDSVQLIRWSFLGRGYNDWVQENPLAAVSIAASIALVSTSILGYWQGKVRMYRHKLKYAIDEQYP